MTPNKNDKKIGLPYFIKIDGCINCEVYRKAQRLIKYEYGVESNNAQPHELMVSCLLICNMQHDIYNPFIGNHELEDFIKTQKWPDSGKPATQEQIDKAIKILEKRREIQKKVKE